MVVAVTREIQSVILILIGGAVLRISATDSYLNYVKPGMRIWLLISAGILLVLGILAAIDAVRRSRHHDESHEHGAHDEPDDGHGHGHGGPKSAWLLLLPVLAIFLIAPPALGAYAAARDTTNAVKPAQAKAPPLAPGDPVEIYVSDYVSRAVWDNGTTLQGRNVQMVGFVTPNPAGGWWLTRLSLTCCAADAVASKVVVLDAPNLAADTWVTVTGTWVPGGGTQSATSIPWIKTTSIVPTKQPKNPYE